MNKTNDSKEKRINAIVRIVLIIIIIILLIHNCTLLKRDKEEYNDEIVPAGNIAIIDIECKD